MSELPPTLEAIAFALQHAPGIGSAGLRRIMGRIVREKIAPAEFLALGDAPLAARFALSNAAVGALRHPTLRTMQAWEELQERGVRIALWGRPGYPERLQAMLGDSAPPMLYWVGSEAVLDLPAVGFCGSRKASEKGLQVARKCARLLALERVSVVSGYAHGVDLAAHEGALEAGGWTILVLAEGILHFRPKQQIKRFIADGGLDRIAVVSEFPPSLTWKAHNAMTRNRTICGLSNALIVIESGLEGGTFEAGKTALDLGEPLFCVEYSHPAPSAAGNPYFLQRGATSVKRSRSGEPNLNGVVAVARNGDGSRPVAQHDLMLREEPSP